MKLIRMTKFNNWYRFNGPTLFILPIKSGETAYSNLDLEGYGFVNLTGIPLDHEKHRYSIICRLFLFKWNGGSHLICQEQGDPKLGRYVTIMEMTTLKP